MASVTIDSARRFEDLHGLTSHDMPYDFGKVFNGENRGARSRSRKKFKLLKKIHHQIQGMLEEDETVLHISSGLKHSFLEELIAFLFGVAPLFFLAVVNGRALVFTTQRILLIHISRGDRPARQGLKFQVRYPEITQARRTFLGNLKLRFRNGSKTTFVKIHKRDRVFIQNEIERMGNQPVDSLFDTPVPPSGIENLCPQCHEVVQGFPEGCPTCDINFKSSKKAGWLSMIIPGAGDFYLGYRKSGIFEIIITIFIWISVFQPINGQRFDFITILIVFLIVHGLDALHSRYVAKKGLYPAAQRRERDEDQSDW